MSLKLFLSILLFLFSISVFAQPRTEKVLSPNKSTSTTSVKEVSACAAFDNVHRADIDRDISTAKSYIESYGQDRSTERSEKREAAYIDASEDSGIPRERQKLYSKSML